MRRLACTALAATTLLCLAIVGARAADLGYPHHRHHRHLPLPPPGYAYGGYGNGPGPGWVGIEAPGYAPGITPGWGYIPAGAPPTIFDLGY